MLDAGLAITIFFIQLVLTWYGVHISVRDKRIRNGVIIGLVGIIGMVLTGWAAVRAGKAQERLQRSVDELALGYRYSSEVLSKRYTLGYVIFRVDDTETLVAPKGRSSTDNYDFDWKPVRYLPSDNPQLFKIKTPDISQKAGGFHLESNVVGGSRKVGWFMTYHTSEEAAAVLEVLDYEGKSTVFVIGLIPIAKR